MGRVMAMDDECRRMERERDVVTGEHSVDMWILYVDI
jgi:hypothetical protein